MSFADLIGGKEGDEGSAGCFGFDGWAPNGSEPFDEAHDAGDLEAEVAGGSNCLDGGGTGGADVIDNDDARALCLEALDTVLHAVLFFSFAHQETFDGLVAPGQAGDGDGS